MIELCFATNNANKIREVKAAMPSHIKIVSLDEISCKEELPETSDTLEGNSFQKAKYVLDHYGISCFADDSGLEVDSLNGAPGVYSARYAGPQRSDDDNINLLLSRLISSQNRRARFRTVFSLVSPDRDPLFFEGIVYGSITKERRGTEGFGYDPVFLPDGSTRTFAEMYLSEKNELSHRSIAVKKLVEYLHRSQRW
jgi:XTP/dITP diphosphohydrolase